MVKENKEYIGLQFRDSDGNYVGIIKRIEERVCLLGKEGPTVSIFYVSPSDYNDDWYELKGISIVTNGEYIRSQGNSGLYWVTHNVQFGEDGQTAMFKQINGVDFVTDNFEKWLCLAYIGNFAVEVRPEPVFDDWDSIHDPARRGR